MQVKKITAKIRDMVKISLMENGDERAWYNNIELPDEIKALEIKEYRFNVLTDGRIEFQIIFEPGILPKTFPQKKARKRRAATAVGVTPATPAPAHTTKTGMTPQAIVPKPEPKPLTLAPKPETKKDAPIKAPTVKAATKPTPRAIDKKTG